MLGFGNTAAFADSPHFRIVEVTEDVRDQFGDLLKNPDDAFEMSQRAEEAFSSPVDLAESYLLSRGLNPYDLPEEGTGGLALRRLLKMANIFGNYFDTSPEIVDTLAYEKLFFLDRKEGALQSFRVYFDYPSRTGMREAAVTVHYLPGDPSQETMAFSSGAVVDGVTLLSPLMRQVENLGHRGPKLIFEAVGVGFSSSPRDKKPYEFELNLQALLYFLKEKKLSVDVWVGQSYGYYPSMLGIQLGLFKNTANVFFGTNSSEIHLGSQLTDPFGSGEGWLQDLLGSGTLEGRDFPKFVYLACPGVSALAAMHFWQAYVQDRIIDGERIHLGDGQMRIFSGLGDRETSYAYLSDRVADIRPDSSGRYRHYISLLFGRNDLAMISSIPLVHVPFEGEYEAEKLSRGGGIRTSFLEVPGASHAAFRREHLAAWASEVSRMVGTLRGRRTDDSEWGKVSPESAEIRSFLKKRL